jgi:hypothetical protein
MSPPLGEFLEAKSVLLQSHFSFLLENSGTVKPTLLLPFCLTLLSCSVRGVRI